MNASRITCASLLFCAFLISTVVTSTMKAEAQVRIGDLYAGNGCVRVGDIVAGDCKDEPTGSGHVSTSDETTEEMDSTRMEASTEEGSVPESTSACPSRPSGDVTEATVGRAVDGDTLELVKKVSGTDVVRMIGVDSPEIDSEDSDTPEPGAEEATRFTAENLEGKAVLLEMDEVKTDDYGRLLAYVWIPTVVATSEEQGAVFDLTEATGIDDSDVGFRLFNAELIEAGHAEALTIPLNDSYSECFEGIVPSAEENVTDNQYDETTRIEETVLEVSEDTTSDAANTDQYVEETEYFEPEETTSVRENSTAEQTSPVEETTTYEPEITAPGESPAFVLEPDTSELVTETYEPSDPASESGTLPTVETSSGPVSVLPDTGGLSGSKLLLLSAGVVFLIVGIFGLFYSLSRLSDRG